jgi:origin recognition complex subunit 3
LRAVARAHASRPPCSLPGSALFCVTSTSRLREAVQAAPRLALEQQMANPQPFLRCGCCPPSGGASASLPDCCAAYTLLQDAGDAANVHEWFRAFCEMHASSGGPEAKAKATAKARGAGNGKGRRARAELDERGGGARASEEEDEAPETNGLPNAGDEETKNGKETFSLEKRRLWELQARFTRAAAELEFLGVARPVKRRKVEYMQRTAFPLDQLLGEDGL